MIVYLIHQSKNQNDMETQNEILSKNRIRQYRNNELAIYIASITTFIVTYSLLASFQYL